MKKVFLDSDVILDFLLDREPFIDDITDIIEKSISQKFILCVSAITITNINYIIGKLENSKQAKSKTKKILKLVKVENVGESSIQKSIQSKFKDFENGVQNYCAVEAKHKIIITKNVKDFKESNLAIMTPKEFCTKIEA